MNSIDEEGCWDVPKASPTIPKNPQGYTRTVEESTRSSGQLSENKEQSQESRWTEVQHATSAGQQIEGVEDAFG